jgi:hypothetical protein
VVNRERDRIWRITRRAGAWPRWLLIEDVIAHAFVIEIMGGSSCSTETSSSSTARAESWSQGSTGATSSQW